MKRWFEVEVVTFSGELRRRRDTAPTAQYLYGLLGIPAEAPCFVRVSLVSEGVSWGEFELWCSGSRAVARILEHREHDAHDPEMPPPSEHDPGFMDEDGSPLAVPVGRTVRRDVAVAALHAWIGDQKPPPLLQWS